MSDATRARLDDLMAEVRRRERAKSEKALIARGPAAGGLDDSSELVADAPRRLSDHALTAEVRLVQKSIYGADDRRDVYQLTPGLRGLCASVGALVRRRDLEPLGPRFRLTTRSFATSYGLCPGEPFAEQPIAALGTAWVIDEHHVVTAGHCVENTLQGAWQDAAIVFGFVMTSKTDATVVFDAGQVYFASAATWQSQPTAGDWAVLRVDRRLGIAPLTVRTSAVLVEERLAVIGHPCGLPAKYAGGARMTRDKDSDRFLATLDTFGGNSGSPVLDESHHVVGILVKGAPDWMRHGNCNAAQIYPSTGELGEEVLKVDHFRNKRPVHEAEVADPPAAAPPPTAPLPATVVATATPPATVAAAATIAVKEPVAPDATRASLPNAYALVIQIAGYQSSDLTLPSVSDAADLAAILRDPDRCGYPPARVYLLEDHQATKERILHELGAIADAADGDATVLLYFSGHGGQRDGVTYLLPFEATTADLAGTSITVEALAKILGRLKARKVLLIFDCCHAGGFQPRDIDPDLPVEPGLSVSAHDVLEPGRGWALYASSRAGERSYVSEGERNGIFTKHLLGALAGNHRSDRGYVSVFDIYEYVHPRVVQEARNQHPVFKCELEEPFPVARHGGGLPGQVQRTEQGYLYHALICYARADAPYVHDVLLPALRRANLLVATTRDAEEVGVPRVLGVERGLKQAQRVVVIVSRAFLHPEVDDDAFADNAALQSRDADIRARRYGLVPVYVEDPARLGDAVPGWLALLTGVRLKDAAGIGYDERMEMNRLISSLKLPVPQARR